MATVSPRRSSRPSPDRSPSPAPGPLVVRDRPRTKTVPGAIEIGGSDPRFPALLREVVPPPASLFCLGDPSLLTGPAVSIVGSRAATRAGLRLAETLGAALAAEGVVVVSGLARGIDAAAHAGALSVGGATVGIVAGGLDVGVPHATRPIGRRIAREGCVATEYEAGTPPHKGRFHERNRIVAGLARVVVVVEAGPRSGALITARLGLDAGREVMAVPSHPLAANSAGANRLLAEGAGVVRGPRDVFEALFALRDVVEELAARKVALAERAERPSDPASGDHAGPDPGAPDEVPAAVPAALRPVYEATPGKAESVESIAARAGADLTATLSALTRLELQGLVRAEPGRRYVRPDREEPEK